MLELHPHEQKAWKCLADKPNTALEWAVIVSGITELVQSGPFLIGLTPERSYMLERAWIRPT